MSIFKKIGFVTFILASSAFIFHQSYLITAGEHVGPFYVWKTSVTELKSKLGEGKLSVNEWQDKYNNETHKTRILNYPEKGLSFIFPSEAKSQKDYFSTIEITRPCDAQTNQGVSVYSTRAEINKIYSKFYSRGDAINNLIFERVGITFYFGNCVVAQPTDTVVLIRIYKPVLEFIDFIPK